MQPIIVLDVRKLVDMQIEIPELERALKFIFHFCEQNLFAQGHVEQFFILLDLKDVGFFDVPVQKLKPLIFILSTCFKGQMYRLVSCNTSALVRGAFNIIQLWLTEFERESMTLCGTDAGACRHVLSEYMSTSMLEKKFGGSREDIVEYFPPMY